MYAYNHGSSSSVPQGYASSQAHGGVNPAFVPPPGFITANIPSPASTPSQISTPRHTPTPPPPTLNPVQVPAGCYPIELVQFWRSEHKRGKPFPLQWALFVRTAPLSSPPGSRSTRVHTSSNTSRPAAPQTPRGNFYELVGTPDTYTAQFLSGVTFSPETLPDWRGTHVIGWIHPSQLGVFESVVRQVPVWRHRADWRCQQWVYEVMCALGPGRSRYEGVYVDGCTFGGIQRQMTWLLDAWESGDI